MDGSHWRLRQTRATPGIHRMSLASRVLSRIGFGTGALVTALVIATGVVLVGGERTLSGLQRAINLPAQDAATPLHDSGRSSTGPAPGEHQPNGVAGRTDPSSIAGSAAAGAVGASASPPQPGDGPPSPTGTGPAASAPGPSPPPRTSSATAGQAAASLPGLAHQVLAQVNAARREAGRKPLTMDDGLARSAAAHSAAMAAGCGLSHRCTGEAGLGERISARSVIWTAAGENIGEGGPEPDQPSAILAMAKQLTADMLAETAPDDGHRRNLLSRSFHRVGISLYRDPAGTVWMTQDFCD